MTADADPSVALHLNTVKTSTPNFELEDEDAAIRSFEPDPPACFFSPEGFFSEIGKKGGGGRDRFLIIGLLGEIS